MREESCGGAGANAEGHVIVKTTHSHGGEVEEILDVRAQDDLDTRDGDVVRDREGSGTGTCRSWTEAVRKLADEDVDFATRSGIVEGNSPGSWGLGAKDIGVYVLFKMIEDL